MINCILLVLLLFVSMVLLKCTRFPLVVNLLNFIQFFHLKVFLIMILPVSSVIFFDQQYLMITLLQGHFFFLFLKLRMQIFPVNVLFPTMQLVFLLIFHFKKPLTLQYISFSIIILTYTSLKKNLKNFSFLLHHRFIFFLAVNFIIKLIEQPWVLSYLLSFLMFSWVFSNLYG